MKWSYVKGYGTRYKVFTNGSVISTARNSFNGVSIWKQPERVLKPYKGKLGYLTVALSKNGKSKLCYVHRLLAEAFILNPEQKKQVNHKDGNKVNNKLSNLEWVTQAENIRHAFENNLIPTPAIRFGQENTAAKLTNGKVEQIRRLKGKEVLRITADKFGVSVSQVWSIQHGKSWAHLKM